MASFLRTGRYKLADSPFVNDKLSKYAGFRPFREKFSQLSRAYSLNRTIAALDQQLNQLPHCLHAVHSAFLCNLL